MRILKKLFAPKEIRIALGVFDELGYKYNNLAFKIIRDEFERNALADPNKAKEVIALLDSIRSSVINAIYTSTFYHLSSGEYHLYRDFLNPTGEDLLSIFNDMIEEIVKEGRMTAEDAEEVRKRLHENIKEMG